MTENTHPRPTLSTLFPWFLLALIAVGAVWIVHDVVVAQAATPPPAAAHATDTAAETTEPAAADPPAPAPVVVVVAQQPDGSIAVATTQAASPAAAPATTRATAATRPAAPVTRAAASTAAVDRSRSPLPAVDRVAAPRPEPARAASPFSVSWLQIVASDGAVVMVGPNGRLVANTGSAAAGGVIAIDSATSTISTAGGTVPGTGAATVTAGTATATGSSLTAGIPAVIGGFRDVDLAGYEDHSLHVDGNQNLVAYDDANLFVDHIGRVNANTGDTDSSAINAVDVTGSVIRTGDSGGVADDDGEEPEEPEEPETLAAATGAVTAPREGSLVVGADGVDDLSVHATGDGNVIADEDSNLVKGGIGPVNAQVGDSDTAGVVAMGVHDSTLVSGCAADDCQGDG